MIKLYYNISTTAFIGKVADPVGEVWTQGDDGSKELRIYFGTGTTASFTNGLTSSTIYDYNCRVYATRPGETTAGSLAATAVVSGSDIYYKIIADSWITGVEGNVTLNTQRYTASVTIAYGVATQAVGAGTPGVESTYALATDLATLESSVNDINAAKYEKSGLVGTAAEIAAGIATDQEVYTADKADELLAANSVTDQAYTDTEVGKVVSGTYTAAKATADDDGNDIVDTYQTIANKVTSFQATPDDTHYPSEKLVADTFTPMTRTILDLDLTDDIELAEFKTALGEATTSLSGLLSAEDKTRLDALYAIFNETADGSADSIVDNLTEILAIFDQYPEGADLVTALAAKEDKSNKKTSLTDNSDTYYPSQKAVKTAVDLKIAKDFTGYTAISVADTDLFIIYDTSGAVCGKVTAANLASYINIATGTFSPNGTFDAETTTGTGLVAEKAQQAASFIVFTLTYVSAGLYKCDTGSNTLTDGNMYYFLMPDSSADTADLTISVDNGTTYYNVQAGGVNIAANQYASKLIKPLWDSSGTVFYNLPDSAISDQSSYSARVNSTYGSVAPLDNGSPDLELKGLTLYQMIPNGNFLSSISSPLSVPAGSVSITSGSLTFSPNGTASHILRFTSNFIAGNKYYVEINILSSTLTGVTDVHINGASATNFSVTKTIATGNATGIKSLVITATTNGTTADLWLDNNTTGGTLVVDNYKIIPLTNTPLASYTAAQVSALALPYFEGIAYVQNPAVKTVGKNLFDKNATTVGYYANSATGNLTASSAYEASDYIMIKPSTDYYWNGASQKAFYDSEQNYISGSTSSQFTTPSNALYVRVSLLTVNRDTVQLEQGTTATTYEAYKSQTQTLTCDMLSVGSVQDRAYFNTDKWNKEKKVASTAVVGAVAVNTTNYPLAKTGGTFTNYLTAGGSETGVIGTDSTTGNGTLLYELATPTTTEIESDGAVNQYSVTTISQSQTIPAQLTFTWALNKDKQIEMNVKRLNYLQDEVDDNEVAIASNLSAIGTVGDLDTTATDLVEAVNEVKTTADAAKTKTDYLTVTAAASIDKMAEWTTLWSTGLTVPTADPGSANITLSAADTGFTFIVFEYYIDTTNSAQERMGLVWVPSDGTNGIKNTRFSQRALITTEYHAYILRNSSTTYRAYGATLWTYTVDSPASISTADSTEIKLTKIYGVKI